MKAAIHARFGPAECVELMEMPDPVPGAGQILVAVEAAGVTTADWRLRAAAFPGGFAVFGRLMFGLWRPRQPIRGTDFAGVVRAVGPGVHRFSVGDAVVGVLPGGGAHAQMLVVAEDGIVTHRPCNLGAAEAAALPFSGLTASAFLREFASVQAGQQVLILGASGAVGSSAVQIAAAAGAQVTAVGGPAAQARLRALGAVRTIDYSQQNRDAWGRDYDLVFDTAGIATYREAAALLAKTGTFLPLEFGVAELWAVIRGWFGRRPRILLRISSETRAGLEALMHDVARGALTPVVAARLPFDEIVAAHRLVESRHAGGPVIVEMGPERTTADVARDG
ncbi:MAG: NAD(P)-dependent alcohol dehydrogenase [Pseudomonadota bacterium]